MLASCAIHIARNAATRSGAHNDGTRGVVVAVIAPPSGSRASGDSLHPGPGPRAEWEG
jgi:hypothetical protein